METHSVVLEEGGVKLSLTVVDTPGFGDKVWDDDDDEDDDDFGDSNSSNASNLSNSSSSSNSPEWLERMTPEIDTRVYVTLESDTREHSGAFQLLEYQMVRVGG